MMDDVRVNARLYVAGPDQFRPTGYVGVKFEVKLQGRPQPWSAVVVEDGVKRVIAEGENPDSTVQFGYLLEGDDLARAGIQVIAPSGEKREIDL